MRNYKTSQVFPSLLTKSLLRLYLVAKIILQVLNNFPYFVQSKNYLSDSLISYLLYFEAMTCPTQHLLERISFMRRRKVSHKSKFKMQNKTSYIPYVSQKG